MVISRKLSLITFSILILVILIATFADQSISSHFIDQNSIFGTLFQNYGLFPPTLILIISMTVFNFYIIKTLKNTFAKVIIMLLTFVFTLIKTNSLISETVQYILSTSNNIKHHKPMGMANNEGNAGNALSLGLSFLISFIILLVIAFALYQFWLKNLDLSELDRLFKVSVISFMVLFIGLELVDNMKELWGRVRPYELSDKGAHFY